MTTLQVVAIQSPPGRKHEHVRVFAYRVGDLNRRIVEVSVSMAEAADLIAAGAADNFPEIEVEDRAWAFVVNTGDMEMVYKKGSP